MVDCFHSSSIVSVLVWVPHAEESSIYSVYVWYIDAVLVYQSQSCMHCCSAPHWDNTVFTVIIWQQTISVEAYLNATLET